VRTHALDLALQTSPLGRSHLKCALVAAAVLLCVRSHKLNPSRAPCLHRTARRPHVRRDGIRRQSCRHTCLSTHQPSPTKRAAASACRSAAPPCVMQLSSARVVIKLGMSTCGSAFTAASTTEFAFAASRLASLAFAHTLLELCNGSSRRPSLVAEGLKHSLKARSESPAEMGCKCGVKWHVCFVFWEGMGEEFVQEPEFVPCIFHTGPQCV